MHVFASAYHKRQSCLLLWYRASRSLSSSHASPELLSSQETGPQVYPDSHHVIYLCISAPLTLFIYLFGVLRRFQHCAGHITTGSWKGRGNQYIQFIRVLYCKLPTNGKQLPAFPLEAVLGLNPGLRCGRRECYHSATMAPPLTLTLLWIPTEAKLNHMCVYFFPMPIRRSGIETQVRIISLFFSV